MSYFAYVIYSDSHQRFYKGHCVDIDTRLKEHNSGKTKSIKAFIPFRLVYFEEFETREESIHREKYFKTAAGRKFIKLKLLNKL